MILVYQYTLNPTIKQAKKLAFVLESQRQLYNASLQERIDCYQKTNKSISYFDQCKSLTQIREDQYYADLPLNIQRWTLKRLDGSFKAFFRRLKIKAKAGFPRFRGLQGWHSFGFNEFSGIRLIDNKLVIKNIGKIKVHFHRSLPPIHEIKSCVFTYTIKGWKINFQLSIPDKPKINIITTKIGLDLGLKELITLSNGEKISNIRTTKEYADLLRRRQRKLSRCKLKSKRRIKVKKEVAKVHHKITHVRKTYLHRVSAKLVNDYDLIGIENLQVKNMTRNHHLAKSIHDVSWSKLIDMIVYKAERAGKHVVLVDPKYTSQTCSCCGYRKKLSLSERIYECDNCRLVMDRDHNAAINILDKAWSKIGQDYKAVVGLEPHNVMDYHERVSGINLEFQIESLLASPLNSNIR